MTSSMLNTTATKKVVNWWCKNCYFKDLCFYSLYLTHIASIQSVHLIIFLIIAGWLQMFQCIAATLHCYPFDVKINLKNVKTSLAKHACWQCNQASLSGVLLHVLRDSCTGELNQPNSRSFGRGSSTVSPGHGNCCPGVRTAKPSICFYNSILIIRQYMSYLIVSLANTATYVFSLQLENKVVDIQCIGRWSHLILNLKKSIYESYAWGRTNINP